MRSGVDRALSFLESLPAKRPLCELWGPRPVRSLHARGDDLALAEERALAADWLTADAAWRTTRPLDAPRCYARRLIERSASLRRAGGLLSRRFVQACLDHAALTAAGAPLLTAWCLHEQGLVPLTEWLRLLQPEEQMAWGVSLALLHDKAGASDGEASPDQDAWSTAAAAVCDGLLAAASALASSSSSSADGSGALDVTIGHLGGGNGWAAASRGNGGAAASGVSIGSHVGDGSEVVLYLFLEHPGRAGHDGTASCSAAALTARASSPDGVDRGRLWPTGPSSTAGALSDATQRDALAVWRAVRLLRASAAAGGPGARATALWTLEWLVARQGGALGGGDCSGGILGAGGEQGAAATLASRLADAVTSVDRIAWCERAVRCDGGVNDAGGDASAGSLCSALRALSLHLDAAMGTEELTASLLSWPLVPLAPRSAQGAGPASRCLARWLAVARHHCCSGPDHGGGEGDAEGEGGAGGGAPVERRAACWAEALGVAVKACLESPPLEEGATRAATHGGPGAAAAETATGGGRPVDDPAEMHRLGFLLLLLLHLCGIDVYTSSLTPVLQARLSSDGDSAVAAVAGTTAAGARGGAGARASVLMTSRLVGALAEMVPWLCLPALELHRRLLRPFACRSGGASVAVADLLDLMRTRISDLESSGGGGIGAAAGLLGQRAGAAGAFSPQAGAQGLAGADPDAAEASAIVEEMLAFYAREKSFSRAAQQVAFFRTAFWRKTVTPLLLAPLADRDADITRRGLLGFLNSKGILQQPRQTPQREAPPSIQPGWGGAAAGAAWAAEEDAAISAPPPADWAGLLEALPSAASGDALRFDLVLSSLAEMMRQVRHSGRGGELVAAAAAEEDCCAAARAAGGLAPMLQQLLQAFARCATGGPSSDGACAETGRLVVVVQRLLWEPQLEWPALHRALWGWLRLAVANRTGAHERPLALLLLCVGSLQRRSLAAAGKSPAACAGCDAHARSVLHARGRGCAVDTLLANLPIEDAEHRAWSTRLAAACLVFAAEGFDAMDVGGAPPEAWAQAPALPEAGGGAGATAPGGEARSVAEARPRVPTAWLPRTMMQLLLWLTNRAAGGADAADAADAPLAVATASEHEAAAWVRQSLLDPVVAAVVAKIKPPSEQQLVRWQLLVGLDDSVW